MLRSMKKAQVIFQHLRRMSSSSANDEVIMETINSKGRITMNRPKALNALNLSMIRAMYPQLKAWEDDPSISMVIIKGVGDKAFCAGGDIRAVVEAGKKKEKLPEEFFKEEYILNNAIGTLSIPWIALIDGITMGGGVGLSVHGQYRVATERTMFAMPETAIGLFPDVGGGYFLPRLGGKLGIYLSLTGFRLKGRDVQKAGIATHFVDAAQIENLEKDLLSLDEAKPKDITNVLDTYHKESTIDKGKPFVLEDFMDKINSTFNAKTVEGIFENLRKDGSDWAEVQLDILRRMSPTSMKITLEQIRRGANMTLQDVLQMEYRISQRCVEGKDFYEGVRAVIIEKDLKPNWDPPTIIRVNEPQVLAYFEPLPDDRDLVL